MTPLEARDVIASAIGTIAPEIDLATVDPARGLADQVEMDSMDQLNVMIEVSRATGLDIPERDYPQVRALDEFVRYLVERSSDPT